MHKYFLIFFMILGAADFAYGLWSKDSISILIGGIMIVIAFSIMKKGKQGKKDKISQDKPGERIDYMNNCGGSKAATKADPIATDLLLRDIKTLYLRISEHLQYWPMDSSYIRGCLFLFTGMDTGFIGSDRLQVFLQIHPLPEYR